MRILLIEDSPGDAQLVKVELTDATRDWDVEIVWVMRLGEAMALVDGEQFDVCLLDLSLPDAKGAAALQRLRKAAPNLPVVVFTGLDDDQVAMQTLREGGQDYLVKGTVDGGDIMRAIRYAQERMRLECDLRRSHARFEDLARSSSDWFWEMDSELRYTWFSERADLAGLNLPARIGRRSAEILATIIPPDRLAAHLDDLTNRRPFRNLEYTFTQPDGRPLHLRINGVPVFDHDGRFTGYRGTGSDITALKQAELERDESRRAAERANQAKSVFLANMSHELRSPLNAILGFAEIIMGEMMGPVGTPRYREYAGDIHSSGAHLLELINDILDVSKIEAGKWILAPEPLDLRSLTAECLHLVEGRAKENRLALGAEVAATLPPLVADRRAAKQCLLNLLTNAVKFTPAGGNVAIVAKETPDATLLIVRDSGIGIPASEMPRLLRPFEQVDCNLTRKLTGTGLGLSLTKSLVDMHGGTLSIVSREGAGTEVTLSFPLIPTIATAAAAPAGPA